MDNRQRNVQRVGRRGRRQRGFTQQVQCQCLCLLGRLEKRKVSENLLAVSGRLWISSARLIYDEMGRENFE